MTNPLQGSGAMPTHPLQSQRPTPLANDAPVWGPIVAITSVVVANILCASGNENSWAWRRFAAPRGLRELFFVSNRAPGVGRKRRPRTYLALELLNPEDLVTSFLLNTPMLLVLHACTVFYWAAFVVCDLLYHYGIIPDEEPAGSGPYGEWMSFFTNWSLTLLSASGLLAFANTARRFHRERTAKRLAARYFGPGGAGVGGAKGGDGESGGAGVRGGEPPAAQPGQGDGGGGGPKGGAADVASNKPSGGAGVVCGSTSAEASVVADGGLTGAAQRDLGDGWGSGGGVERGSDIHWSVHPLTRPRETWDWLSTSHLLTMETATSSAFCVSLWYWVGLVVVVGVQIPVRDASNYQAHAGNTLVALLQVALTRLPYCSYHFQLLLAWGSLYLVFLWIYGSATGIWRYGLNIQSGRAAGAVALLPAVCFVTWLAWFCAAKVREAGVCAGKRVAAPLRGEEGVGDSTEHAQASALPRAPDILPA